VALKAIARDIYLLFAGRIIPSLPKRHIWIFSPSIKTLNKTTFKECAYIAVDLHLNTLYKGYNPESISIMAISIGV
jgi:hypothetical protein